MNRVQATEQALEAICAAVDDVVEGHGITPEEAFSTMPAGLTPDAMDSVKLYYHVTRRTLEGAAIIAAMDQKVEEIRRRR